MIPIQQDQTFFLLLFSLCKLFSLIVIKICKCIQNKTAPIRFTMCLSLSISYLVLQCCFWNLPRMSPFEIMKRVFTCALWKTPAVLKKKWSAILSLWWYCIAVAIRFPQIHPLNMLYLIITEASENLHESSNKKHFCWNNSSLYIKY